MKRTRLFAPAHKAGRARFPRRYKPWMKKAAKPTTSTHVSAGGRAEARGYAGAVAHCGVFLGLGKSTRVHCRCRAAFSCRASVSAMAASISTCPAFRPMMPVRVFPCEVQLVQRAQHAQTFLAHDPPQQDRAPRARPWDRGLRNGFVGDHDLGVLHQHSRDGHALLLAARKLGRAMLRAFGHATPRSRQAMARARSSADAVIPRQDNRPRRWRPIAPRRTFWEGAELGGGYQVELLKHVAHAAPGSGAARSGNGIRKTVAMDVNTTRLQPFQPRSGCASVSTFRSHSPRESTNALTDPGYRKETPRNTCRSP